MTTHFFAQQKEKMDPKEKRKSVGHYRVPRIQEDFLLTSHG